MSSNNSRFGIGGCFSCVACGKKTRKTGKNDSTELCNKCYDMAGMENEHNDGHHNANFNPKCPDCVREDKERFDKVGKQLGKPDPEVKIQAILEDIKATLESNSKATDFTEISKAMWPKKGDKIGKKKKAEAKAAAKEKPCSNCGVARKEWDNESRLANPDDAVPFSSLCQGCYEAQFDGDIKPAQPVDPAVFVVDVLKYDDTPIEPTKAAPAPKVTAKPAKEAKKVPHCCQCRKAGHKNLDSNVLMSYVRASDPKLNKIFMRGNLCKSHRNEIAKDSTKKVILEAK